MSSENYESLITRAHFWDISERYDLMSEEIKKVIKLLSSNKQEISVQARNLFSLAYKNLVSSRRSSWRVLSAEKHKKEENKENIEILEEFMEKMKEELIFYCDEVLKTIEKFISLDEKNVSHNVFFIKMKADYFRYKSEVFTGGEQKKYSEKALSFYEDAKKKADTLETTDPIRLGLYLNYSVFYYEILNDTEEACKIAKSAFDNALSELDTLSEENYKDSTLIMQLIRDNLTLWTSRNEEKNVKNSDKEENK